MSFDRLYTRIENPNEIFILQKVSKGVNRNEIGDFVETWEDQQILKGGVQSHEVLREFPKGKETIVLEQRGYFTTELNIPQNDMASYRIKQTILGATPIHNYYEIERINRNLNIAGVRQLYKVWLTSYPKYEE